MLEIQTKKEVVRFDPLGLMIHIQGLLTDFHQSSFAVIVSLTLTAFSLVFIRRCKEKFEFDHKGDLNSLD